MGGKHYEVRVQPGPLADRLATLLDVDLENGGAHAMETMTRNAQSDHDNHNPNLEAAIPTEELEEAREKERLYYEQRQRQVMRQVRRTPEICTTRGG